MKFINTEQIHAQIINQHGLELNLSFLHLADSHIIELLPAFRHTKKNTVINLSHNKITDFGAILLISELKSARSLILEENSLSVNFLQELSKQTWAHDLNLSLTTADKPDAFVIQLADFSHKSSADFNALTMYFSDYLESIYQTPSIAKISMLNFLFVCVKNWRDDYIQDKSYQQVVSLKKLPGDFSENQRLIRLFELLISVVKYACEVERLINVYKSFIKAGEAEALLLKEINSVIRSICKFKIAEQDYYDNYDFVCDIFDYFVKRYNDEIDGSLFFGTSPIWREFIKNLRETFSNHIEVTLFGEDKESIHNVKAWEKVKSRSIFTLHRDKYARLLTYFSSYLGGRTQTLINIDREIAWLRNGRSEDVDKSEVIKLQERSFKQYKPGFFKPQAIDHFAQLLSAIRLHDSERVAQLLSDPNLINEVDTDFWSPIHHWAATSQLDKQIFSYLVRSKPNIVHEIIKTTGWNAIFVVINNCCGESNVKLEKLELLCQYGVDYLHADDLSGKTPIHYAVISDDERIIEALTKLRPDILMSVDNQHKSPKDLAAAGSAAERLLSRFDALSGDEIVKEWRVIL